MLTFRVWNFRVVRHLAEAGGHQCLRDGAEGAQQAQAEVRDLLHDGVRRQRHRPEPYKCQTSLLRGPSLRGPVLGAVHKSISAVAHIWNTRRAKNVLVFGSRRCPQAITAHVLANQGYHAWQEVHGSFCVQCKHHSGTEISQALAGQGRCRWGGRLTLNPPAMTNPKLLNPPFSPQNPWTCIPVALNP